jgi:transcriptional regulator GlxA family with amidase domain
MEEKMSNTISILATENSVASVITGLIDYMNIANLFWETSLEYSGKPLFKTEIVGLDSSDIRCNSGIIIKPEKTIDEVKDPKLVMLPAFLFPFDVSEKSLKPAVKWIKQSYERGARIAATCTGSFLMAESGILNGRTATTNWYFANMFRRKYPDVELKIDKVINVDGRLISSGAATAFLNLCLYLIEEFGSKDLAQLCSKALLIDPNRKLQSPYIAHDFWKNHLDTQILKAQQWMEENFTGKIYIDDIADIAAISPRHFKRRFKKATNETPLAYIQHLRIEYAKELLEKSSETINEITYKIGYEDINSFRRLFKKNTGISPKDYRNNFAMG